MINENTITIGQFVDVFEKDGFETERGKVTGYENGCILVKCKNPFKCDNPWNRTLKIPLRSVSVSLNTRGNSLAQYVID